MIYFPADKPEDLNWGCYPYSHSFSGLGWDAINLYLLGDASLISQHQIKVVTDRKGQRARRVGRVRDDNEPKPIGFCRPKPKLVKIFESIKKLISITGLEFCPNSNPSS